MAIATKLNRRGVEQPQIIIYLVYAVILALAGIYTAWTYLGGVDVEVAFSEYTTRFNSLAAQLAGSPECFAYEANYYAPADGKFFDYSKLGIISKDKLPANHTVSPACISQKNQFWLQLSTTDGRDTHIAWSCPAGSVPCQANPGLDWPSRKYPVLFYNGSIFKPAMLEVRLSP